MDIREFIKNNPRVLVIILVTSSLISLVFLKNIGFKDSIMVFLATVLLLLEIYLLRIDRRSSILLFILSLPILVTARKVCYFDLLILRVSYESVYISLLFVSGLKGIIGYVRTEIMGDDSQKVQFLILTLVFVIFAVNSSIFSKNVFKSLSATYISVVIPVMFMLSVVSVMRKQDKYRMYYMLIAGLDLSCLYGFLQIFMNRIPLDRISSNRVWLTFGYHNINIFAGILMLIVPFTLDMILYRKNSVKEKYFLCSSMVLNMSALFLTYTRGAWLTFIIAAFIILLSKKYRKVIYVFAAGFVVVAKPLITFILSRGTSTTSLFQNESAIARLQSLFTSMRIMLQHPFGAGAGSFPEMYKEFAGAGYLMMPDQLRWNINVANYALENAHNLWLQIGVELGIICVFVFVLIIINRMSLAFQNYSENRAGFTAIIVYLIFSILTGIEFDHKGVITGTLIIWLIFAMIRLNSDDPEEGML